MELCGWCKKRVGVNQLYRMDADGTKEPTRKLCDDCWIVFKTPSKTLQRLLKKDGVHVDPPIKPTCVLTKAGRVVECNAVALTEWLCAGWTVVGVADTEDGLKRLQELAKEVMP